MTIRYSTKPSAPELTGLVRSIWCYQADIEHKFEQVLPSVTSQLLINLHDNELRHWVRPRQILRSIGPVGVQGVLTAPVLIDTEQKRYLCGVAFTSIGLSAFCDINASRFTDVIVDAVEIWGPCVTGLRSALIKQFDPAIQCEVIENFLAERLTVKNAENELIEEILCLMSDGKKLADMCRQVGLSQRSLHNLFDKRIGVRPKTFARIDRFCSALGSLSNTKVLTDLALDHGFSDQSHFTREFGNFAGKAPTQHRSITNESQHTVYQMDNLFKTPLSE